MQHLKLETVKNLLAFNNSGAVLSGAAPGGRQLMSLNSVSRHVKMPDLFFL